MEKIKENAYFIFKKLMLLIIATTLYAVINSYFFVFAFAMAGMAVAFAIYALSFWSLSISVFYTVFYITPLALNIGLSCLHNLIKHKSGTAKSWTDLYPLFGMIAVYIDTYYQSRGIYSRYIVIIIIYLIFLAIKYSLHLILYLGRKNNINRIGQKALSKLCGGKDIPFKSHLSSVLKLFLILSLILGLFTMPQVIAPFIRYMSLSGLPIGAVNGDWSARAVEEGHHSLVDTMEELIDTTELIVRGEIIGETRAIVSLGSRHTRHLYTVYEFEVLENYKGGSVGSVLDIIQVYRLESKRTFPADYPYGAVPVHYIREDLSVGDELILFLRGPWPPFVDGEFGVRRGHRTVVIRNIQGAYRYTPEELRYNHEDWIFESVNPHNNLILTEAYLQRLRNLHR